ncbi:MAG: hypothetical protein H0U51_01950 [Propionibacteriales bacterium]|nr:hypothetical protein [Propionibacteriales bacterium]
MSSLLASARARSSGALGAPRPQLDVVPVRAREARRVPFVALVVGTLTIGLVGLLVLNTSLQRGAYLVTDLRSQAADLTLRQQNLQVKVAELQAPQRVAEEALAIGMVQGDNPAFLSLTTGKVIGVPQAGRVGNQLDLGNAASPVSSASKASPLWAGTNNNGTTGLERAPGDEQSRRGANPAPRSVR